MSKTITEMKFDIWRRMMHFGWSCDLKNCLYRTTPHGQRVRINFRNDEFLALQVREKEGNKLKWKTIKKQSYASGLSALSRFANNLSNVIENKGE